MAHTHALPTAENLQKNLEANHREKSPLVDEGLHSPTWPALREIYMESEFLSATS